ncbi:hypothetical protein B0H13DRAFT_2304028 [Mycena leptocephala]|nr:hypothetical protein B0H13DRAFT_2304028 [Mycena leptocephala]
MGYMFTFVTLPSLPSVPHCAAPPRSLRRSLSFPPSPFVTRKQALYQPLPPSDIHHKSWPAGAGALSLGHVAAYIQKSAVPDIQHPSCSRSLAIPVAAFGEYSCINFGLQESIVPGFQPSSCSRSLAIPVAAFGEYSCINFGLQKSIVADFQPPTSLHSPDFAVAASGVYSCIKAGLQVRVPSLSSPSPNMTPRYLCDLAFGPLSPSNIHGVSYSIPRRHGRPTLIPFRLHVLSPFLASAVRIISSTGSGFALFWPVNV